jgi:hypothetical protein
LTLRSPSAGSGSSSVSQREISVVVIEASPAATAPAGVNAPNAYLDLPPPIRLGGAEHWRGLVLV